MAEYSRDISESARPGPTDQGDFRKKSYEEVVAEVDKLKSLRFSKKESTFNANLSKAALQDAQERDVIVPFSNIEAEKLAKAEVHKTMKTVTGTDETGKMSNKLKTSKNPSKCEWDEDEEDELARLRLDTA